MNSKFSNLGNLQKPPAVCKTPPPQRIVPPPPHYEQNFQGYASWYDSDQSDWVAVSGVFNLVPLGNQRQWSGITPAGDQRLEILMTWIHPLAIHRYDLTLIFNGLPVQTVTIQEAIDRSFDPFDSGLLLFPEDAPSIAIQARVNT